MDSRKEDLLKKHQRDINCLLDDDRNLRKQGLNSILKGLFSSENENSTILAVFNTNVVKNLVKTISDPIEKNRELTFQIIDKFLTVVSGNEADFDKDTVQLLSTTINARISSLPYLEKSEEIRLQIAQINIRFIQQFADHLQPLIGEIAQGCASGLTDSYPEVKKMCSTYVMVLSEKMSKSIGHHSGGITKSLATNLSHQHSKVRKITIEALTKILLCEAAGIHLKDILSNIRLVINDKNNDVRKCVFNCIGSWISGFSLANLREYESELISLLLNSLSDEMPDIVELGQKLIEEAGLHRKLLAIEMNENVEEFV